MLYRNNLLSDCSYFKYACVTYVTYGDIISNEVHYRLVTELASLAQSREILLQHLSVGSLRSPNYMYRFLCLGMLKCLGGITWPKNARAQFWAVKMTWDTRVIHFY